jgi:hypothetical protein
VKKSAGWRLTAAWIALALLFVIMGPLFVCMPPWVDNTYFEIAARSMLRGEVIYRDLFFHHPPGMIFAVAAVGSTIGWRSEALRLVDLCVVGGIILILVCFFLPRKSTKLARTVTALLLWLFYFSTDEWCHCQTDTWMLLPSLIALWLRQRQLERLPETSSGPQLFTWALLEGIAWGLALSIKPFAAIPAVVSWLVSVAAAWRQGSSIWKLACDFAGLISGGLVIGLLTFAWMKWTGNWPFFLEASLIWNRDYWATSPKAEWRLKKSLGWFHPWSLVHIAALPTAVWFLCRGFKGKLDRHDPRLLLSALYVGWFYQSTFLQREFIYQMVQAVMLGLVVVASAAEGWPWWMRFRGRAWQAGGIAAFVFVAWAVVVHPLWRLDRLAVWPACWSQGSSSWVRDRLALNNEPGSTDWERLDLVQGYLESRQLKNRELTCFGTSTVPLYWTMDLQPSSRFILLTPAHGMFREHREAIYRDLLAGPQRYVVGDVRDFSIPLAQANFEDPERPFALPEMPHLGPDLGQKFPMMLPVVFRKGRYYVHEVTPESRRRWRGPATATSGPPLPRSAIRQ